MFKSVKSGISIGYMIGSSPSLKLNIPPVSFRLMIPNDSGKFVSPGLAGGIVADMRFESAHARNTTRQPIS